MAHPLSHIKVLDFTHLLTGPYCTRILGDLGADIIKVERPHTGDPSRQIGPFINGKSMYFVEQNRNKRSIVLDMKTPADQKKALDIAKQVDVIVENFRPGVAQRLGLDYGTLSTANPRLIYVSCSGYGNKGPMADQPAFDGTVQAASGIMGVTGKLGGKFSLVGYPVVSTLSGCMMALGVLSALYERKRSGKGQVISVSMYDAAAAIMENPLIRYCNVGIVPTPIGNSHPAACPFSSFKTKDGDIIIATTIDDQWARACHAIGHPELIEDPRFITMDKRRACFEEILEPLLNSILQNKTTDEWCQILREHNVACGAINTFASLMRDPQVEARHMIVDIQQSGIGNVKITGTPLKFSRTQCETFSSAPELGEHTQEVLQQFGINTGNS